MASSTSRGTAARQWTNVTGAMPGCPSGAPSACIEPSPFDAGTAYVVVDAHRLDDLRPYLYKTTDFGQTWKRLDAGLPQDIYLHAVREDPQKRGLLYVGTERGVDLLDRRRGDLALAAAEPADRAGARPRGQGPDARPRHARPIDLDPRRPRAGPRVVAAGRAAGSVRVSPRRTRSAGGMPRPRDSGAPARTRRAAPPSTTFSRAKPKGELTIEILDAQQRLVRRLSSVPPPKDDDPEAEDDEEARLKKALADRPGRAARRVGPDAGRARRRSPAREVDAGDPERGPMVPPGTYTARITRRRPDGHDAAAGRTRSARHGVRRGSGGAGGVRDAGARRHHHARVAGRAAARRCGSRSRRGAACSKRAQTRASSSTAATAIAARCDVLERQLHNPTAEVTYDILAQRGGAMLVLAAWRRCCAFADEGDGAPTQGMKEMFAASTTRS